MELNRWKFHLGEALRHGPVTHDVCYQMTKAGGELGDPEWFLSRNDWTDVELPHDWCAALPVTERGDPSNGYKPRGVGWYHTSLELPALSRDESALLEFEGAMGQADVFVNGTRAMRNFSGYTGFCADVSDLLAAGENRIAVRLDARQWEGWWYEGAGLYRPARLILQPPVHLRHLGAFVLPVLEGGAWRVEARIAVESGADQPRGCTVSARFVADDGRELGQVEGALHIDPHASAELHLSAPLDRPPLWSPDSPSMCACELTLHADGQPDQRQRIPMGCRHIEWTVDRGMLLNGVPTPVNGICCHQDHAGVGIALPDALTRYRVQRLKEMGVNAYRCAHHAASESLLAACDELGMLVMAENRHFSTSPEALDQLDSLVLRARNHPSVFLYSLFNEEHPWQSEPRGRRMAEHMRRRIRALDPSRPVTAAMNGGVLAEANASDVLDVAGMNYFIGDYMAYHARRPDHPMVATENGPLYATRGVYRADKDRHVFDSYGETTAPFGQRLEDTIEAVRAAPHVAGQFVWGGFDYRGEPQPYEWPSVLSHWGLMDYCGFEKDTFHQLRSYYANEPVLHLLPHWNFIDGETVRVCAFTNRGEAELFLNGQSLGRRRVQRNRAEWQVPFQPGELVVRAAGLEARVRTVGPASALQLTDATPTGGADARIVNVDIVDAQGLRVPDSGALVRFHVAGGTILGTGNGDPNAPLTDTDPSVPAFQGRCQVIVRPGRSTTVIQAESDGLNSAQLECNPS